MRLRLRGGLHHEEEEDGGMVGDYNMRSIETVQEDILSYNPSITTKLSFHSFISSSIDMDKKCFESLFNLLKT